MRRATIIAGCCLIFAAFVGAESSGCEEIDKSEQSSAKVTRKKARQIRLGDTKREVRNVLGRPQKTDHMEFQGMRMDCWYYGVLAERSWQFCFNNGRLESKNRY
jgi:outer membrane protein assembly factor BamE (lipoprotein component of BamABCDE complex)